MLAKHFLVILLSLSIINVSHARCEDFLDEGSPTEVKITAVLCVLQGEIMRKLDAMDKKTSDKVEKIPTILNELGNKINVLEKLITDLQEGIHEKLRKLEKNIVDNLEQYIDNKMDSSEKHIYRKIDALEKNMPDKIDINNLNRKLDVLKNSNPDIGSNVPIICESKPLDKAKSENNQNLDVIKKYVCVVSDNITLNSRFDNLEKQIFSLEENLNHTSAELKQMIPAADKSFKHKLDVLYSTVQKHIVTNNLSCNKVVDVHYEEYKPLIRMDNDTLHHVTFRNDKAGLAYYEMHLAIKAPNHGVIKLSSVLDPGKDDTYFEIDIGCDSNSATHIHLDGKYVNVTNTPNILSSTRFTAFYVKISADTLEFGREGSSSPILTCSDARLKTVQYFSFSTFSSDGATFLYDCPPNMEMLATPCYSIT